MNSLWRAPSLLLAVMTTICLSACCPSASSDPSNGTSALVIQNKGSDTMVNLALAWAEHYQSVNPSASISVTGGGSGTGIAALINGTVDIANASRSIKPEEIDSAEETGSSPVEFVVAKDAIAVIVNHQNPINELSLDQVSDIYSGRYSNWKELGGEDRPIVRLSRETNSGTHVFFLENVLRTDNRPDDTLFSTDTLLLPSSEGITTEVRQNPNAIGYDGLGYVTDEVKVIAIAEQESGPFVLPSAETVNSKDYPIARDLYMYTAGEPTGLILNYLEWISEPEAQQIVRALGFVPVQHGEE